MVFISLRLKSRKYYKDEYNSSQAPADSHRRNVYPRKVNVNKLQECPLGENCPRDVPSVLARPGGRHNAKYTADLTTYLKYLRLNAFLSKNWE